MAEISSALGTRIHVIGNSCSGKSTLAEQIGAAMDLPVVELDGLNWLPNWVGLNATDPEALRERIREATQGDQWVLAGSYAEYCADTCWPRLQTMIWLDMPRWRLIPRVLRRSWRRWHTQEQLWGTTNTESFFKQLMVWRGEDSLVGWIWTQAERKRRRTLAMMSDPRYAHIRFIRLTSPRDVQEFVAAVQS